MKEQIKKSKKSVTDLKQFSIAKSKQKTVKGGNGGAEELPNQ